MKLILLLVFFAVTSQGAVPWNMNDLFQTPQSYDAPEYYTNGVKACFYESVAYTGVTTRVFAYYGFPTNCTGKVPAMVLIHGGGGSAFWRWVQLWNSRGYAAIAMDTCGSISGHGYNNHPRSPWGGPEGWGGWKQTSRAFTDQWTYHAVGAVIKGHSLLRSFKEVDPDRIGVTGISWGGYLTCIVAPLDTRFKFAVPVYGCGYIYECPLYGIKKEDAQAQKFWNTHWDPSLYLPFATMPFLWVTGSNDFAFPMDSLKKSYSLVKPPSTLCLRVRMPHGHGGAGENPAEILAFAESIVNKKDPLPVVSAPTRNGQDVTATIHKKQQQTLKGELNYTCAKGAWKERKWETIPAQVDAEGKTIRGVLPEGTTVYYFNVILPNSLVVSTPHEEL
jgi:pimeloyl-ACP methyl ester carboxylesterase